MPDVTPARRICLVGTIPEPIGGVSVHVGRLAELCTRSGYATQIFDLQPGRDKQVPHGCVLRSWPTRWQAALAYRFDGGLSHFDLVHIHVSRLRTFLLLNAPLAFDGKTLKKVVLTFHSGLLEDDLNSLFRFEVRGLSRILQSCGKLIAVNSRQADILGTLADVQSDRIAVIPAYLPLTTPDQTHVGRATRVEESAERRVIVASGYGTPLYGWHDLISAIRKLPSTWLWTFCFYNSYDRDYYQRVRDDCRSIPNVECMEDISPERFHSILRNADTYVRPTTIDGDSIALREALALGLRCVASDAADRPAGVVIYPAASLAALCESLLALPCGRQEESQTQFGARILRVYDEVYAGSS